MFPWIFPEDGDDLYGHAMYVCVYVIGPAGKNKLFVWLPREYVHLADPLRIKGTGSRGS